ncbi:MAG: hypothetical protein RBU30_17615, partial [Polyangia bacterium]|nr:hypothetical protein [Polyangia bacterium]
NAPTPSPGPPMSGLLDRLPGDVTWALVTGRFRPSADRINEVLSLLSDHPALEAPLRAARAKLEGRLGVWPFEPAGLEALGLTEQTAVAIYGLPRRAGSKDQPRIGVLVSGVRPQAMAEAISNALRRRGRAQDAAIERRRVGGRLLLSFGSNWSCAFDHGATRCIDGPPETWDQSTARGPSLRSGPLAALTDQDLSGDLGFYHAKGPERWPEVAKVLVGIRPRRVWGALSLEGMPRLHAVLLGSPSRRAPRRASMGSPEPAARGRAGLAAASGAELTVRLSLRKTDLLALLELIGPAGAAAKDLLGRADQEEVPSLAKALTGDLILLSFPDGLGAILELEDPAKAKRGLASLWVELSARLTAWQAKIRQRGPGWDLLAERPPGPRTEAHGLLLQLPKGKGSPLPDLPGGQLRLIWGIAGGHLLIATNLNLFRRLRSRLSLDDEVWLSEAQSADRRRAFALPAKVSLALRMDDPLALLSRPQRELVELHLKSLGPLAMSSLLGLGLAGDLLHELTLSLRPHPAGTSLEVCLGLPHGPSAKREPMAGKTAADQARPGAPLSPLIPLAFREALGRKWGGNLSGYAEALTAIGRQETPSWLRDKARRNQPSVDSIQHAGLHGLAATALLPMMASGAQRRWRAEAMEQLALIGQLLRRREAEAAHLSGLARRRWHRPMQSAPPSPSRLCCGAADRLCRSTREDWWHPTWRFLGFQLEGPHRFIYDVSVEPGNVRTRMSFGAEGDLDCDGRSSRYLLRAEVEEATGRLTLGEVELFRREPGSPPRPSARPSAP